MLWTMAAAVLAFACVGLVAVVWQRERSELLGVVETSAYEYAIDLEDGEYDCTCEPEDPCPAHRAIQLAARYGCGPARAG